MQKLFLLNILIFSCMQVCASEVKVAARTQQESISPEMMVDELIKTGALKADTLIDVQDKAGYTPLMIAINRLCDTTRRVHVVRKLLKAGANPNMQRIYGWTALMDAATQSPDKEIIVALLNNGANPHTISHNEKQVRAREELFYKNYLYAALVENNIKQTIINRANQTFFSLLERYKPEFVEDRKIKKALADYEVRFAQHTQAVTDIIETTITRMPTVLTNIICKYALDGAPPVSQEETHSWCVIS